MESPERKERDVRTLQSRVLHGRNEGRLTAWQNTAGVSPTASHPWLTTDRGWQRAGQLHLGESVRLLDGGTATVVALRDVPGVGVMWDLSLDATHTFAVGDVQAVVHTCPQGGVGAVNKGQRGVDAANDILTAQGKMGIQTEVTFETPGAKTRVDLASLDPNTSTLTVAEAKNGMTAALTTNQSLAYPYFVNNDVANIVPMGQNAANLGLQPGVSLANQGISQVDFRIFWFDI